MMGNRNFTRTELPPFYDRKKYGDPILVYRHLLEKNKVRIETATSSYICDLNRSTVKDSPRYNLPSNEDKEYRIHIIKTLCLGESD